MSSCNTLPAMRRNASTFFITAITLVAIALVATACSSSDSQTTTTASTVAQATTSVPLLPPSDYAEFRSQPTACGGEQPEPVTEMTFDAPDDMNITEATIVTLTTSCGPIEITVDPSLAPETVNSFVFLAEEGYFDGSVSHRVVPGFMVQAGDPTATGRGGPDYTIPDEFPAAGFVYDKGVVAMANAGPGSSGSQFFIMVGDADWLPPSYSVFGHVTNGFETLAAIEGIPLGINPSGADSSPSTPLETLYIESVVVNR